MCRCSLALVFALCVGSTGRCQAEVIYSQTVPENPISALSSQDTTSGQIIADNFILTDGDDLTVRSLRFLGARINDSIPEPIDSFRIGFFEDDNGVPGDLLTGGDFDSKLSVRITDTGGPLLNGLRPPRIYEVDLGEGISLAPDVVYWVAITNDPGPGFGWVWARADHPTNATIATVQSKSGDFAGLPWVPGASSAGMWFELSDQAVVPEPSTAVLLIVAVALVVMDWFPGSCLGT